MTAYELLARNLGELQALLKDHECILNQLKEGDEEPVLERFISGCPHKKRMKETLVEAIHVLEESRQAFMISCDQELGEILGAWIRFGVQDDDAAVTYEKLYSGGLNLSGKLWRREQDNIGIGYGYLDGGNMGVDKSQVVEGYVRFGLNEYVALTLDVQYMEDKYVPDEGTNVDGWIVGARMTVEF